MVSTGFSQISISEGIEFPMGGMFLRYACDKVHTPLYASAWALEDKGNQNRSGMWVSCDVAVFEEHWVKEITEKVEAQTSVPAANVVVSTTHTHTGPTTFKGSVYGSIDNQHAMREIVDRTVRACVEAWEKRSLSYMVYGEGQVEKCCYNRRYLMKNGVSQMHPGGPDNPERLIKEGPEDKQLQVVWFENEKGITGVIVNFSTHPSVLYGIRIISADFPGVIRRVIQNIYGDIPVLYLQGCCGNTSPVNHAEDPSWGRGMESCERVGTILGAEVVKIIASTRVKKEYPRNFLYKRCEARLNYREITEEEGKLSDRIVRDYNAGKITIKVENGNVENVAELAMANKVALLKEKKNRSSYYEAAISAMMLDNIAFVTNPAELFVEYQLSMKKRIPADHVIVASITNGWCNYVATKHGFLFKGYEVDQGWFDWEAGQTIEDTSVECANSLISKQST